VGVPAVKLLLIPGLTEAFFDGGLGVAFFDMPVRASLRRKICLVHAGSSRRKHQVAASCLFA
jgi:hypothetical protein